MDLDCGMLREGREEVGGIISYQLWVISCAVSVVRYQLWVVGCGFGWKVIKMVEARILVWFWHRMPDSAFIGLVCLIRQLLAKNIKYTHSLWNEYPILAEGR